MLAEVSVLRLLGDLLFMSIRILSWNVRGINNPQKMSVIKNLLRDWKCDVVCLQETKLSSIDLGVIRSLWSIPYVDWVVLYAVNTAEGGGVYLCGIRGCLR